MSARPIQTRHQERASESEGTRIRLLEGDADEIERKMAAIDAKLNWILRTVLVGTLTLAANIAERLIQGS